MERNVTLLPPVGRIDDLTAIMGWSQAVACKHCRTGKVKGAYRIGKRWYIPATTLAQLSAGADPQQGAP